MAKRKMKYNPAFLTPAELIDQFVVRHGDLDTLLETVRENTTSANQHVLVIGPRGSGKTMLVRRVAAEIERDPELSEHWFPLIFSEEAYEVTTPGEFWLEAAFHLGQQTKDPRWQAKYDEYGSQWPNEDAMREQALAQLMAFADEQGKRLLLIVENLNGLLGDQLSDDDAWKLRHTLQNEPRVMLLATATSRFEEIDNANKAMYELFRVHHLRPLETDECRDVWQSLTGQLLEGDQVRPIQILTGGNLRLLTILSAFGAGLSFRQLMGDLVGLVDDHTGYFKSHLDALPPIERKVYLALAELWDPSTAREVAAAARLDVNRTSSLLRRLVDRGAVATLDDPKRTKWYQVAERMYNIYYLFRRRGSPAERVRAVVRFMVSFYAPVRLLTAARHIADEVRGLDPAQRQDHYQAYCDLLNQSSADSLRHQLIEVARDSFADLDDVPDPLAKIIRVPNEKLSRFDEAELTCHWTVLVAPQSPWADDPLLDLLLGQRERCADVIQCALSNLQEALKSAEKHLADESALQVTLEDATNLMVELAARGEGRRALQVLLDSPSRNQLEPLAAGIRIFLGEDVTIAAEIKEIGLDVAKRIGQRRDALEAASA